jgi:hypothetical protein
VALSMRAPSPSYSVAPVMAVGTPDRRDTSMDRDPPRPAGQAQLWPSA